MDAGLSLPGSQLVLHIMIQFIVTIQKFGKQGEKTGWTYIEIPSDIAEQINPGIKKSFRVKGKLDQHRISGVSLLPMGDGKFIMALNAAMRKGIGKRQGAKLDVQLEVDKKAYQLNKDFMECLADEPDAAAFFQSIPRSFQHYFSKWIDSAKTEATQTKRIAQAVSALARKMNFPEMIRSLQKNKNA